MVARIAEHGVSGRIGQGFTYFLTLTAPGDRDHRRWVQGKAGGRGPCDCHGVWETTTRGEWNAGESAIWNRYRLALSRLTEGSLTYMSAVEVQDGKRRSDSVGRGMLHRHVLLNSSRPLLPEEVGALALTAGYGCVHDLQEVRSAASAAGYLSKYVMKSAGTRGDVHWKAERLVVDCWRCGAEWYDGDYRVCPGTVAGGECGGELHLTGEFRMVDAMPTYRTWSAARSWGFTLKGLREIARLQARARAEALRDLGDSDPAGAAAVAAGSTPPGETSGSPP